MGIKTHSDSELRFIWVTSGFTPHPQKKKSVNSEFNIRCSMCLSLEPLNSTTYFQSIEDNVSVSSLIHVHLKAIHTTCLRLIGPDDL